MASKKKGSIGRQKIPMAKIQKESHRQVTFSKRKAGLFKKASELCTLCGVEVAIIVFSPARKPFSFGHSSVDFVLDRYMSRNKQSQTRSWSKTKIHPGQTQVTQPQLQENTSICELNMVLTQLSSELEEEKKKGQAMEEMRKAKAQQQTMKQWWEAPMEEMNIVQLQQLKLAAEELRNAVSFAEQSLSVTENKAVQSSYMSSTFANSCNFGYGYEYGCF